MTNKLDESDLKDIRSKISYNLGIIKDIFRQQIEIFELNGPDILDLISKNQISNKDSTLIQIFNASYPTQLINTYLWLSKLEWILDIFSLSEFIKYMALYQNTYNIGYLKTLIKSRRYKQDKDQTQVQINKLLVTWRDLMLMIVSLIE